MMSIRIRMGIAAAIAAAGTTANAAGGWEQFHGTHGNNGCVEKGPDLRIYGTPRIQSEVPGVNDFWGYNPSASGPVVMDGRIFCYGNSGAVSAYDESSGQKLWTNAGLADGSKNDSWSSPSASNGRVYIGSGGVLYCLDAENGQAVWTYALDLAEVVNASVTVVEDLGLCFLHTAGWLADGMTRLHAVNIADGTPAWTLDLTGDGQGHVAYNPGRKVVYTTVTVSSSLSAIVAIDAVGGTNVWTSAGNLASTCYGAPAFDAGLNWVVALSDTGGGGTSGTLLVCDATDGSTISRTDGLPSGNCTPAIGQDGAIYLVGGEWDFGSLEGTFVYAVDGFTGAEICRSPVDEDSELGYWGNSSVSAVYAQDIGDGTDVFYCTLNGLLWNFAADRDEAYAMFSATDGSVLGLVDMSGGNAALANGNLYFINWDSELVAFGPPVHIVEVAYNGAFGKVSPARRQGVADGENITFTFDGTVTDVLTNGVSVGVCSSFTFVNVTANCTLSVVFADPATFSYLDWLSHYGVADTPEHRNRWTAGLTPDGDDQFLAHIELDKADGLPNIWWTPDLTPLRQYTPQGKVNLTDSSWEPADRTRHFFFRIRVEELQP
ncbi:MAG: PQQ-binding-like beta-propeller repeat protein [Kiritimatiellaeota bacterium]|nr:PQQ-binding-like beta-propeller repeat protein [Kiritimatiellota bacterium]